MKKKAFGEARETCELLLDKSIAVVVLVTDWESFDDFDDFDDCDNCDGRIASSVSIDCSSSCTNVDRKETKRAYVSTPSSVNPCKQERIHERSAGVIPQ